MEEDSGGVRAEVDGAVEVVVRVDASDGRGLVVLRDQGSPA